MTGVPRRLNVHPLDDAYLDGDMTWTRSALLASRGYGSSDAPEDHQMAAVEVDALLSPNGDISAPKREAPAIDQSPPPVWLTGREAARRSGIPFTTFRRAMAAGLLPIKARQVGPHRRYYLSAASFDEWMATWRG